MFIQNTWYVAAWSHEISSDTLFARTLLGQSVVMWRGADDRITALPDRCPHRGAPLSQGRIERGQLRCMYHGMMFDASGACTHIPGQARMPPGADLRCLPVVERNRWVWIWMGDPALADPALIPDTWWLDSADWRYRPDYMHYGVNYLLICDNLLDFSHLAFVHEKTLGGGAAYAEVKSDIDRRPDGLHIERWHMDAPPAPFVTNLVGWTHNVDRWNIYDFVLPGILLMDSGSAMAGSGARQGNRSQAVEFRSAQALTPETENSTHYFFSQAHNFALDDPTVTDRLHAGLLAGFKEDWDMIHAQARVLAQDPTFRMMPLGVDAALGYFRALVGKRAGEERAVYKPVQRPAQNPVQSDRQPTAA